MKNVLVLLLICALALQSCYVTKYVNNENALRREFGSALASDVRYKKGEPYRVEQTSDGYVYYYFYDHVEKGGLLQKDKPAVRMSERFSFDKDGNVRYIQSDNLVKQKKVDVGAIIVCAVAVPALVFLMIALAE